MKRKRLKPNKHRTMSRRNMGAKLPKSPKEKLASKVLREATIERAKK